LSRHTGFDHGFDDYLDVHSGRNARIHLTSLRERGRWYLEAVRARVDDGAAQAQAAVEQWTTKLDGRPFFGFVNLLECHSPCLPPRPYGGWSPVARLKMAHEARRYYTLPAIWRTCAGVDTVPDDVLALARAFYAEAVRYMDAWLAETLEALERKSLLEETLVIVLADHGENFGEQGLIGHGLSLDERLTHVPFIASGPGASELDLNSLAAVPAQLGRICGLNGHPWTDPPPAGFGISQFDPPVAADDAEGLAKLRGIGIDGDALETFVKPLTCAVKEHVKLLVRGSEEIVFDLEEDPDERSPMDPRSAPPGLRAKLEELRVAIEHGQRPISGPSDEPSEPGAQPSAAELDDLEDRMKLLGYM
jgi:hypothetical protein